MNKENLDSLLSEAFEEGFRSPYELKQFAISEIAKKYSTRSSVPLEPFLQKLAETVDARLLPAMKTLLSNAKGWLCGGAVLKLLCDPKNSSRAWTSNDYDVFCTSAGLKSISAVVANLQKSVGYEGIRIAGTAFDCYRAPWQNSTINVIVSDSFANPEAILASFDITICQMAFTYQLNGLALEPRLATFEESFCHLMQNRIVLTSTGSGYKTKERVKKYLKRGFRDSSAMIECGGLAAIQAEYMGAIC
jgi:hypothetical protein